MYLVTETEQCRGKALALLDGDDVGGYRATVIITAINEPRWL